MFALTRSYLPFVALHLHSHVLPRTTRTLGRFDVGTTRRTPGWNNVRCYSLWSAVTRLPLTVVAFLCGRARTQRRLVLERSSF